MSNKLLIHPGEILKEDVLDPRKLNVTDAAKLLKVTRVNLSHILNGNRSITPLMAIRISIVFGGVPQTWLNLQQTYDLEVVKNQLMESPLHLEELPIDLSNTDPNEDMVNLVLFD